MLELYDHQMDALGKMKNGCILCGGVGSGKTITSIAYYCSCNGAKIEKECSPVMPTKKPMDLYIITTAAKRDKLEWQGDLCHFYLSPDGTELYSNKVVIDSWNNVKKYLSVRGAFFIFDEQRAIGYGTWARSFIHIAKANRWVMLSATPGDNWMDYCAVFIANGFYRNKTDFKHQHCVETRYGGFPQIKFWNTRILEEHRRSILVEMPFVKPTVQNHKTVYTEYDKVKYNAISKGMIKDGYFVRWNPWTNNIIDNASEACQCLRRVCGEHDSRKTEVLKMTWDHPRCIIFYNYDYELEILRGLPYADGTIFAEYNGHKHEKVPEGERWVYAVNYGAGSEGWNCITCDTVIFYSQNYSYRIMIQAAGRIDRLNSPYKDLYYYHLTTKSPIDLAVQQTLDRKKKFNESAFIGGKTNGKKDNLGTNGRSSRLQQKNAERDIQVLRSITESSAPEQVSA